MEEQIKNLEKHIISMYDELAHQTMNNTNKLQQKLKECQGRYQAMREDLRMQVETSKNAKRRLELIL